jgi:galactokinase
VLVTDNRVAHARADGEYRQRRVSCEQAAHNLGVDQLRDVDILALVDALTRLPGEELRRASITWSPRTAAWHGSSIC